MKKIAEMKRKDEELKREIERQRQAIEDQELLLLCKNYKKMFDDIKNDINKMNEYRQKNH